MDAADMWNVLVTHCRDLDVKCGSGRVRITVDDEGWHTVLHRDDRTENAEGTHTHDLLAYLALASRCLVEPATTAQGEPLDPSEGLWTSHSEWNATVSTSDGQRRVHVRSDAGVGSLVPLIEFQQS